MTAMTFIFLGHLIIGDAAPFSFKANGLV